MIGGEGDRVRSAGNPSGGDEREFVANRIVGVESGVNGPKAIVKARKSVAHDSQ